MSLKEILDELVGEMEGSFITPLTIGKKLVKEKKNNEENISWLRAELTAYGIIVKVR